MQIDKDRRNKLVEWGRQGGKKSHLGYFGWLKKNDPEKLKIIQDKGRKNRLKKTAQ